MYLLFFVIVVCFAFFLFSLTVYSLLFTFSYLYHVSVQSLVLSTLSILLLIFIIVYSSLSVYISSIIVLLCTFTGRAVFFPLVSFSRIFIFVQYDPVSVNNIASFFVFVFFPYHFLYYYLFVCSSIFFTRLFFSNILYCHVHFLGSLYCFCFFFFLFRSYLYSLRCRLYFYTSIYLIMVFISFIVCMLRVLVFMVSFVLHFWVFWFGGILFLFYCRQFVFFFYHSINVFFFFPFSFFFQ